MPHLLTVTTLSDGLNENSSFNSILGSARAWINFHGNVNPCRVRGSYNISSVIYNSDGSYTVNFIKPFSDANYVMVGTTQTDGGSGGEANLSVGTYNTRVPYATYICTGGGYKPGSFLGTWGGCDKITVAFYGK